MNDPIDFIVSYFQAKTGFDELRLNLSYYEYLPQTVMDHRQHKVLRLPSVDQIDIKEIIDNCPAGHEVAFHSVYELEKNHKKKTLHVPLIDFCCDAKETRTVAYLAKALLPERVWKGLHIFSSGRSLHGYSLGELKASEFQEFMGRLLLMNIPNNKAVVDSRWVGHRIMAGYASLRISHNTKQYLSKPTFLGTVADFM